jgi:hypothetical protein
MLTSDAGETLTRASGFCCDQIGAVALDRSQRVESLLVRTSALLIFARSLLHILANLAVDAAVSVENRQPAAITNMLQHRPVYTPATQQHSIGALPTSNSSNELEHAQRWRSLSTLWLPKSAVVRYHTILPPCQCSIS